MYTTLMECISPGYGCGDSVGTRHRDGVPPGREDDGREFIGYMSLLFVSR